VFLVPVDPKEFSRDEVVPTSVALEEPDLLAEATQAPPYTFAFGHPARELSFFRIRQRRSPESLAVAEAAMDDQEDVAEDPRSDDPPGVELKRSVRSQRVIRHPHDSPGNQYSYADAFPSWQSRN